MRTCLVPFIISYHINHISAVSRLIQLALIVLRLVLIYRRPSKLNSPVSEFKMGLKCRLGNTDVLNSLDVLAAPLAPPRMPLPRCLRAG